MLDDVSRSVSSSDKVCFQNGRLDPKLTITSGVCLKSLSFCTMTLPDNDAVFARGPTRFGIMSMALRISIGI